MSGDRAGIAPACAEKDDKKSFTRRSGPCKKRDRKEEALSGDGCKLDELRGAEVARVHANLIRKPDDKNAFPYSVSCVDIASECGAQQRAGAIAVS
jgi:hypothetical protein